MTTGRIIWDGNDLDMKLGRTGLQMIHKQEQNQERAVAGLISQINLHGIFEGKCDFYVTEDQYRDLVAWWSWARQGKTFAIAADATLIGDTTLDDAAAAGQKDIPLTATTGFTAGDQCLIRAEDNDDEFELIEIYQVNAGVYVETVDNLFYAYTSGDVFRHLRYFPEAIMIRHQFRPRQTDAGFYRFDLEFAEIL